MKLIALILSLVACALAGTSLYFSLTRGMPGRGLNAYDVSTPQGLMKSELQVKLDGDIRADFELSRMQSEEMRDRLNSLEFEKPIEHDGKTLLLYRFKEDGKDEFRTAWFKKNKSGYWTHTFVSKYDFVNKTTQPNDIYKVITAWEQKGVNLSH